MASTPLHRRSLLSNFHNAPDATVDPEGWYAFWENRTSNEKRNREIAEKIHSDSETQLEMFSSSSRPNLRFIHAFQCMLADTINVNVFEFAWKESSSSERRQHMVEGLVRSYLSIPSMESYWALCSDIRLEKLEKDNGAPFVQLLRFYQVADSSKLTPETRRSYPHPKWAGEMQEDRKRGRGSTRAVVWDIIQLWRDAFICGFLHGTLQSFMGQPHTRPPTKVSRLREGQLEAFKENFSKSKMAEIDQYMGSKKGSAQKLHKQWMEAKGFKDAARYICERCCKPETPEQPLKQCKRCMEKVQRTICYCSAECQKVDWNIHKKICGKQTTLETVKNVYALEESAPSGQRYSLEKQLALLEDPANAKVGYFLFSTTGKRYTFDFPSDPTLKMVFTHIRHRAFTLQDERCILILASYLIRRGIQVTAAKGMTEADITFQLQAEFPAVPINHVIAKVSAVEENFPDMKGATLLEHESDLLQDIWDKEVMDPQNGLI